MKIDLHCHSYYSDGQLSPSELIDRAHNMQVDTLALTDHDTVAGVQEMIDYQAQQKRAMHLVPGVELSTGWHGFDIHVLGLGVDHHNQRFLQRLELQSQTRQQRAVKIEDKLQKCGIQGVFQQAKVYAGKGQITRAHFARAMVSLRCVKDADEAFKKYLGKGKKAHVSPDWIAPQTAVEWIHDAGGQAVLAHPGHYDMTAKWLRRLVEEFSAMGGDGIEVSHGHLAKPKQLLIEQLAREWDLAASVGSDFHFPGRWTELGKSHPVPAGLTPVWNQLLSD